MDPMRDISDEEAAADASVKAAKELIERIRAFYNNDNLKLKRIYEEAEWIVHTGDIDPTRFGEAIIRMVEINPMSFQDAYIAVWMTAILANNGFRLEHVLRAVVERYPVAYDILKDLVE